MDKPSRRYIALAFLPVILAVAALAALYAYHRGEKARRDGWQKPQAIFDALALKSGMRVAEWGPSDTYFLEKLSRRVGPEGRVYAFAYDTAMAVRIRLTLPGIELAQVPPAGLDAVLLVCLRSAEQDRAEIRSALRVGFERLRPLGRMGVVGVGSRHVAGFVRAEEVVAAARRRGT